MGHTTAQQRLLVGCRCDALAEFQETVDNSRAQSKACAFLISKQRKDGGWAESYLSSQTKVLTTLALHSELQVRLLSRQCTF